MAYTPRAPRRYPRAVAVRDDAREERSPVRIRRLGWLFALALVAAGAWLRIHAALADPNFDARNPAGMLKSDPGLVYYVVGRILASNGLPPGDFRADPRVEHPETTDVPATLAVGQEFVVAWGWQLLGRGIPLHVFCVWVMGVWASLCALCVYGLALELTGRAGWAALAAALYAAMPANYRTIGFILVNEDFSLPWFALHLWLLARAVRVGSAASIGLAALALGAAVSTWHATGFFVALEAGCVFLWFARSGRNPMEARRAWVLPATLAAFALAVPVLRSTGFLLSIPMQVAAALGIAARWRRPGNRLVAFLALGLLALAAAAWPRLAGGGQGEYSHVFGLMWEKVTHLGRLPDDPSQLAPEVRLMWQSSFDTLDLSVLAQLLGLGLAGLVAAALFAVRASDDRLAVLSALACISVGVAWLIERTIVLPGLLLPVVGACAGARLPWPRIAVWIGGVAVFVQACFCFDRFSSFASPWYRPPQRQAEIAALVTSIPGLVPEGEAIAADFMTSTAILAHTGHPIVFQPKWESRRSRERAVELLTTFYRGTPDEMREMLVQKYRCRYVVFDRFTLGFLRASRYTAGLSARDALPPSSCAAVFLGQDDAALRGVPGYRLLYRSPPAIRQSDGSPTDFYRLYELVK